MEVTQKNITTVRMHDAKGCEIRLVREGEDYQLQLCSCNHVVNITLGLADVRELCQQLVRMDVEENWRQRQEPAPETKSFFFNGMPRSYQDTVATWYARVAGEACCDGVGKQ
jgi:hypothetical protein